jgi:hypothetical protein
MPAKDVYIGPFAKKCQEYAQCFYPDRWYILSAKYGFLEPMEIVPGPYNVSFNDRKSGPITIDALVRQSNARLVTVSDEIVVLGGKSYVAMIELAFSSKLIRAPLKGASGIGVMMGWMKRAIEQGKAL